jgi:diadenylate cyclase
MQEMFITLGEIWNEYILGPILNFRFADAIDIILLTGILYGVYLFLKSRRAGRLAIGLAVLLLLYAVSDWCGLHAIHELMKGIAPFFIVLIAVIFQPELRDALEKLGSSPLGIFHKGKDDNPDLANTVNEVVEAACKIALAEKDGALIVIERSIPLGDYAAKGQLLDAAVSRNLLCNIFVDRSPLHDGAVIIRNNRIAVAGSKLPLTSNEDMVKGMGTRHRAAVGITEVSDCVVVVVSEERHVISVANNGAIKGDYHIGPAELYGEDTLKAIQNTLLNDLFLLLAGTPYDENGKPAKSDRRFRMNLKFMWGWGDAKKKSAASVDMTLSAASPKSEASPSDGGETGQNP